MRTVLTTIALLLLLAGTAVAQGLEICPGQAARGEIRDPAEVHLYRFEAAEGDSLTVQLRSGKYGPLTGLLRLFAPRRELYLPVPFYGVVTGSDIVLPATGTYYLSVTGKDLTRGPYELRLRVRPQKWPPLVVPLPGEVGVSAAAGSVLSVRTSIERGAATRPVLETVENAAGEDILGAGRLKYGPRGPAVTGLPVEVSGRCRFVFGADGPEGGFGAMQVAVRRLPPRERLLTQSLLPATSLVKVRYPLPGGGYELRLEAAADGPEVLSAVAYAQTGGPGVPLPGTGGHLLLTAALDPALEPDEGDWPDGFYVLRVRDRDGAEREYPVQVDGEWPTALRILGTGTDKAPEVTWGPTGAAGETAQIVLLRLTDRVSDAVLFEAAAAGNARSQPVPREVLPIGWPYRIEARAVSPGRKVTVGTLDVAGEATAYTISWPNADRHSLLADAADPADLRYEVRYTRGYSMITQSLGGLARLAGAGRFAFEATDDDPDSGIDPFPVLFVPGRFIAGRSWEGSLFAGAVRLETSYVATEIAGIWNFVGVDGGDAEHGTILLSEDGRFALWVDGDGSDDPDVEGTWSEQGGVLRVAVGANTFGMMAFQPSASGRGLFVMDRPDGSLLVGAKRQPAAPGAYDGAFDLVSSAEPGVSAWRLSGRTIEDPAGSPVPIEFGAPLEGMFSAGGLEGGGLVGLPAPEGTLFLVTFGPGGADTRLLIGVRQ